MKSSLSFILSADFWLYTTISKHKVGILIIKKVDREKTIRENTLDWVVLVVQYHAKPLTIYGLDS